MWSDCRSSRWSSCSPAAAIDPIAPRIADCRRPRRVARSAAEDGVPAELFVERGDRSETGSIHLGRVSRLVPGLSAALVDIGEERPAFLPQGEVVPRGQRLHEGERVLVQIRREAQGSKAARVTMAVALRGRLVELTIGRPGLKCGEGLSPGDRDQLLAAFDEGPTGLRLLEPAPVERPPPR